VESLSAGGFGVVWDGGTAVKWFGGWNGLNPPLVRPSPGLMTPWVAELCTFPGAWGLLLKFSVGAGALKCCGSCCCWSLGCWALNGCWTSGLGGWACCGGATVDSWCDCIGWVVNACTCLRGCFWWFFFTIPFTVPFLRFDCTVLPSIIHAKADQTKIMKPNLFSLLDCSWKLRI
jgi:hypothetical protein